MASQILLEDMHILFSYEAMLITFSILQDNHYAPIIRNLYDY